MKVCVVYNSAAHYRKAVFMRMQEEFCCAFAFGTIEGIKQIPYRNFNRVFELKNCRIAGNWYWQKGALALVNKFDAFIILGEPYCVSSWFFCLKARLLGKRVFFWTHGWYGKEGVLRTIIKKIYFKLHCGGIFVYGDRAKKLMIEQGFDGNKIWPIHNSLAYSEQLKLRKNLAGTNIYREHFGNDDKTLVCIGRLTERKHLDEIFKAMTLLRSRGENYNLTLIGDGSEREKLEKCCGELGLRERVWFYGACYDEAKNAELIFNADLCVVPGDIGLTAIHALMFGCPCVTHNAFCFHGPEFEAIIPGVTGMFFERGNIEDLAEKISDWFKNAFPREQIRQNCYDEIDKNWNPEYQIRILKKGLGVK